MYRIRLEKVPEDHPELGVTVYSLMWVKYKAAIRPSIFRCKRLRWVAIAYSENREGLLK